MESNYLAAPGEEALAETLEIPRARDLAQWLAEERIDHARLVECRRTDHGETVIFDVRVQVPTRRVHAIRRLERIAATFYRIDRIHKVEALREDFPIVPHLNRHRQELPRDLCIYQEQNEDVKRTWTAPRFVHRIRQWLELNATGALHPDDQALEPLLVDFVGQIVLPHDLPVGGARRLFVDGHAPARGLWFLKAQGEPFPTRQHKLEFVASVHVGQPRTHGILRRSPRTIADVADIASFAGLDLIKELREALPEWKDEFSGARVILVVLIPTRRRDEGQVEKYDCWCFLTDSSVRQLGIQVGIWAEASGALGALCPIDSGKRGEDAVVAVLNPCFEETRRGLARLNGIAEPFEQVAIAGIGAGALGSQIVMNLARSGFGSWTIIDPDRLMPHNLARHALSGAFVGANKAKALAISANALSGEQASCVGVDANILAASGEVTTTLSSVDVIVDMAASVSVQRFLARDIDCPARRICAFMTPSGADLVVLAEDASRRLRVDALEMQYYRALLREVGPSSHVEPDPARHRYGRSCGDVTSAMPQDLVALHAAIASRTVRRILAGEGAEIAVWRTDSDLAVRHVPVEVRPATECRRGRWIVVLDDGVRDTLLRLRSERLPNETGGVVLGSFDMEREILYLVEALPSPPDSNERPDLFIRGYAGLRAAVEDAETKTGGMVDYVGEWHSHPRGASTRPSECDRRAFEWLATMRSADGCPAVMMIVGDAQLSLFVDEMGDESSLIPDLARGEVA